MATGPAMVKVFMRDLLESSGSSRRAEQHAGPEIHRRTDALRWLSDRRNQADRLERPMPSSDRYGVT
jgi:hypothetical protein